MPKIDVDEDVFAQLQERARPLVDTASDVIRGLLETDAPIVAEPKNATAVRTPGRLRKLVHTGLLREGDRLTHTRKRTGETFQALVTREGCLLLPSGSLFKEPSPALREFTGSQIDGWANWTHEGSGRTLRDLRNNG